MRIIKYKSAPQKDWLSGEEFTWIGGYDEAILNIDVIAGFFPVSDGPNGMKRTEIFLTNGNYRIGIGTPNDFVKDWVGDTYHV